MDKKIIDFSQRAGLIKSFKDYRNVNMTAVLPSAQTIPNTFVPTQKVQIINQTIYPDCVACTGSEMESFLQSVLGTEVDFDWQWLYAQCKLIDGLAPGTPGTTFQAMLTVLKNIGCKPMSSDPNDAVTIAKYKIAGYVQVNCDIQSLKTAIFNYGTVLLGFIGSNAGWQSAIPRPPVPGEAIWGHATRGKSFVDNTVKVQNHWGLTWGDNGDFYNGEDYPPFEAWAILTKLPDNWQSLIPNPADKPKVVFHNQMGMNYKGADVLDLQNCLKYIGCMPKEVPNFQNFGPVTLDAVKLYQERNNIPQTGFVGVLTLARLNKDFN